MPECERFESLDSLGRTPTGLAPEIAFFRTGEASHNFPTVPTNAGGGDFVVKGNVSTPTPTSEIHTAEWERVCCKSYDVHR